MRLEILRLAEIAACTQFVTCPLKDNSFVSSLLSAPVSPTTFVLLCIEIREGNRVVFLVFCG